MPAPAPAFYNSTDTATIPGLISASVNAGNSLATVEYHLWNDKGVGTAGTLANARLRVVAYDGTNKVSSGLPILDEAWVQVRLIGQNNVGSSSMLTQTSAWFPLGTNRDLLLHDIPANCARHLEVKIVVPAGAATNAQEPYLEVVYDERSVPLGRGLGRALGAGVIPDWLDLSLRRLTKGRSISAAGTDVITVASGGWVYDGTPTFKIAGTLTLNQTSASGALAVGESYIAVIAQPSIGSPTATKGNRAASPTRPLVPANEILLGYVTVTYQGGGTSVINTANIDQTAALRGQLSSFVGSGLNVIIGAGQAITSSDTLAFSTAPNLVPVSDNATTYIWLLPDGTFVAQASPFVPPQDGAQILSKVVASGGSVFSTSDDVRSFAYRADEYVMSLNYLGTSSLITGAGVGFLPFRAVLEKYAITARSAQTSSNVKFDISYDTVLGSGGTIFLSSGTSDLRPVLVGGTGSPPFSFIYGSDHEVRVFEEDTAFLFDMVSASIADGLIDVNVRLYFRRR